MHVYMSLIFTRILTLLFFLSFIPLLRAEFLELPEGDMITDKRRVEVMPDTGNSRIGKILTRFYEKGLGGPDNWKKLMSLRGSGSIRMDNALFEVESFQKKPNLMKLIISKEGRDVFTLSYDGKVAWKRSLKSQTPVQMEANEARRFIHGSVFGNYLLYPYAEGKRIEYIETIPFEGSVCHRIRVHLDTGFEIDYYLDVSRYHEVKVENHDLRTGLKNIIRYSDFRSVFGTVMAMKVENFEGDELLSSLQMDEYRANVGIMPWMFEIPELYHEERIAP